MMVTCFAAALTLRGRLPCQGDGGGAVTHGREDMAFLLSSQPV